MFLEDQANSMSFSQVPHQRSPHNCRALEKIPFGAPSYNRPLGKAVEHDPGLLRDQTHHLTSTPYQSHTLRARRLRKMPKSSTLSVTLSHPTLTTSGGPQPSARPIMSESSGRDNFVKDNGDTVGNTTVRSNSAHGNLSAAQGTLSTRTQPTSDRPDSPRVATPTLHSDSPTSASNHSRQMSRLFFSNVKASKSSSRIEPADVTIRHVAPEPSAIETRETENSVYSMRRAPGSTPDLSRSILIACKR